MTRRDESDIEPYKTVLERAGKTDPRAFGLEPARLAQGGGARDPFKSLNQSAAECREAIREAVKPFAARGAKLKAIVTFDGMGGVDVAVEVRS